ncbi:unnamed protein product [Brachionus calyciflorus]|uniref:Uncharacterized protein n=1 Tax=Brachionus calyciflorus TaxID=104777 RepID=A0A814JT19_9BILA|nr:unnamed protein product [Brachionus calyciflorus]
MVKSKSRQWKEAKAREIHNRYYDDQVSMPNFSRRRESSPKPTANRQALNNAMRSRGMNCPANYSSKPKSGTPGLLKRLEEEKRAKYELEMNLWCKMSYKERRWHLKKEQREKWEKENGIKNGSNQNEQKSDEFEQQKSGQNPSEPNDNSKQKETNDQKRKQQTKKTRKQGNSEIEFIQEN